MGIGQIGLYRHPETGKAYFAMVLGGLETSPAVFVFDHERPLPTDTMVKINSDCGRASGTGVCWVLTMDLLEDSEWGQDFHAKDFTVIEPEWVLPKVKGLRDEGK